ncbi:hypothetical protein [Mycetocola tolaasinivorans]|uniref:hypothetical protein n=1 Tax=Mycetocola tolaasinivorans TaxID=76635 RepID=UPI0011C361AD|nr:hypothetical protein [Mycetocola tolaasinivorans]
MRAVFPFPDDGRKPGLGYTVLAPVSDRGTPFDECWIEVWPQAEPVAAHLRSTLISDGDAQTRPQLSQLNSRLGQSFPGERLFVERITEFAAPIAGLAGVVIGFAMVRMRRLELASARHSGVTPATQTLILLGEALVPALVSVLVTAATVMLVTGLPGTLDPAALRGLSARVCLTLVPALLLGVITGALTTREKHLFRYFKART